MKVKHNKLRNTGLIFELLVKQIASETIAGTSSPAITIVKKFFAPGTELLREYKIYEEIIKSKGIGLDQGRYLLELAVKAKQDLDGVKLAQEKYNLVRGLKSKYNLDEIFSIRVHDYKALAATYCTLEFTGLEEGSTIGDLASNRQTLLEYFDKANTGIQPYPQTTGVEEYLRYDKDTRMLAYRILLERYNKKFKNLNESQKTLLREFILSVDSTKKLQSTVVSELQRVKGVLESQTHKIENPILQIKLQEVIKQIVPQLEVDRPSEETLVSLLEYYELVEVLDNL